MNRERITVAFIGTGLIGRPMAARLLECGHAVVAWNRTLEKTEPLRAQGAEIAESAASAVLAAECVIAMLADEPAVRSTMLSADGRAALAGRTLIQMGTISSEQSRRLQAEVESAGGDYLEAPVLGSRPQASAGELIVLVGSSAQLYARWEPLLACLGPEPRYVGPVGSAATFKLALNQLIASLTAAFSLSLSMIRRSGIEVDAFMEVVRASAVYAPTFDKKLERMLKGDYTDPNFPVSLMLKDVDLILEEASGLELDVGLLQGVRQIVLTAIDKGLGGLDYSAMYAGITPREA